MSDMADDVDEKPRTDRVSHEGRKKIVFDTLHRERDTRIPDELLKVAFGDDGKLSKHSKALLAKAINRRSAYETAFVRELCLVIWPVVGKSMTKFARLADLTQSKAQSLVWEAHFPICSDDEVRLEYQLGEKRLEKVRFENKEQLVNDLWLTAKRAQKKVLDALPSVDAMEALAIMDKAIRLALNMTGGVKKPEEKPGSGENVDKTNEQLIAESERYGRKLADLKVLPKA